jgi:heat shock protein HslJ
MVSRDGQPVSVASTMLGDRVQINAIAVENNQIVVDMVQAGPDDPMCCPTQQVIKTFELQGDQLVEISSQTLEETSATPQLVGPVWQWEQTLMNNGDRFIPDNPGNYTVQFLPDGTVAVQADCNQVGGSYTLDGSRITIELGPSTMAACPEGSLSDQFLANLSAANIYFFNEGNLFIDLMFDSGTMRFSPEGKTDPVDEVMNKISLVQHIANLETKVITFICASSGQGLNGVAADPEGPRFVGPNAGDFDLWGIIGLFKVNPDGSIEFVTQQPGGKFLDLEGGEHDSFTLDEALDLFAGGAARWTGDYGEPGRIAECDPTNK